ncbi:hypothetical protein CPB85DRAFT_1321748 [Mucidula mucida]|nr:hypothetical protein CPB85DRAFT_1321748 [Mucidula mucida]
MADFFHPYVSTIFVPNSEARPKKTPVQHGKRWQPASSTNRHPRKIPLFPKPHLIPTALHESDRRPPFQGINPSRPSQTIRIGRQFPLFKSASPNIAPQVV